MDGANDCPVLSFAPAQPELDLNKGQWLILAYAVWSGPGREAMNTILDGRNPGVSRNPGGNPGGNPGVSHRYGSPEQESGNPGVSHREPPGIRVSATASQESGWDSRVSGWDSRVDSRVHG